MKKLGGIFLVNNDGKVLICHPTGHTSWTWSIPKGNLERGETPFEGALRETWEETNVKLPFNVVKREITPQLNNKGNKELHTYLVLERDNSDLDWGSFQLKCNSHFWRNSLKYPEMDQYQWIDMENARDLLSDSQKKSLDEVIKIYKSNT